MSQKIKNTTNDHFEKKQNGKHFVSLLSVMDGPNLLELVLGLHNSFCPNTIKPYDH